jgi:hypothetical protein
MTVADILYFGAITHVAIISAFVLLRQYIRGDLAEHGARARRDIAVPIPRPAHKAVAGHRHRPQAA